MSSSDIPRKVVAQRGRPLRRQPTGLSVSTGQPSSHPKRTTARRKLHKERSMRIPAIENDMMNRIGLTKKRKAMARAASTKAGRSSSPYKSLLAGIARTEDVLPGTSDAEGHSCSGSSSNRSGIRPVRCASPSPLPKSPTSPLRTTRSASPQPPKLPTPPATETGGTEAKGKKQRTTRQCPIVLRPLPSRVAASSSHRTGSPAAVHPLSRTPTGAPTTPKARSSGTRSRSFSPRKLSTLIAARRPDDLPPTEKSPSVPVPKAAVSEDRAESTAQPIKVQGEGVSTVQGTPCVNSGEASDSQSEDSDATSHEIERAGSSVPDVSASDVAQAAAMKQSLLSQIEGRNEGGKWDDLQGFLHSLAPSEIYGLLKTATRAGRRALRRLAGKEVSDLDNRNGEDDARVLGRAQGKSVLAFEDAISDGEEVTIQTTLPLRQRKFLYKAKGKARAGSPSPPLSSSPSPVFVSQTAFAANSSRASDYLSASHKRSRTPESASDDDDDTSEPPTKRQKKKIGDNPRPLRREGAFIEYSVPLPVPAQEDIYQNDDDDDKIHVNLIKSFLDQIQDLDIISSWFSRGSGSGITPSPPKCDPFTAARDQKFAADDDDVFVERRSWMPRPELQDAGAYRRHRGARADDDEPKALDGAESDDDAARCPTWGNTSSCAVPRI
ncbi:hypothetical protein BJY52DRAFT_1307180 [Lactarius psammicola]|nr:hypothetical protein BJY52DRAFT_1307180 [Lactarius psammicola]